MPPKPIGRPPKPDAIRQRTHKRQTTTLAPVDDRPVPLKPPPGLLPVTRKLWRAYWQSAVSRAAEINADQHILSRWIQAVDEWERVYPVFKAARLVKGSMGQPTLNPLVNYLRRLEDSITYAEQQLGMTPSARARLGIAIGEAKLTAEELNRRLSVSAVQVADVELPDTWEGEWQAV